VQFEKENRPRRGGFLRGNYWIKGIRYVPFGLSRNPVNKL